MSKSPITAYLTFLSELLPMLKKLKAQARLTSDSEVKNLCNLIMRAIDGAFMMEFKFDPDLMKSFNTMLKSVSKKRDEELKSDLVKTGELLDRYAEELDEEKEREKWDGWEIAAFYLIYSIFTSFSRKGLRIYLISHSFDEAQKSGERGDFD